MTLQAELPLGLPPSFASLVVNTDGASRGNPGPASIAYVIYDGSGEEVVAAADEIGRATNNVAEYRALIAALEHCARLGAGKVRVRSDSQLIVRQMQGRYKVRDAGLAELHAQASALCKGFDEVRFEHVGREENKRADGLAQNALKNT